MLFIVSNIPDGMHIPQISLRPLPVHISPSLNASAVHSGHEPLFQQSGDSLHVSDLIEQEPRITSEGVRTIANVLVPRLIADDEAGDEEEELEEEAEAGGEDAAAAGDEGGEE